MTSRRRANWASAPSLSAVAAGTTRAWPAPSPSTTTPPICWRTTPSRRWRRVDRPRPRRARHGWPDTLRSGRSRRPARRVSNPPLHRRRGLFISRSNLLIIDRHIVLLVRHFERREESRLVRIQNETRLFAALRVTSLTNGTRRFAALRVTSL